MKIKIDNPLRGIQHDLSREPYIAGMWAETKSMAHHAQRVENLLSIECKLQAAQNCPDDWLTAWGRFRKRKKSYAKSSCGLGDAVHWSWWVSG